MADFNYVQIVFDRSLLSPDEDVAIITQHIRKTVPGAPDILPMDQIARDAYTAKVSTPWWNAVSPYVDGKTKLKEIRYYDVKPPGVDMGDPVDVRGFNAPGTGTSGPLPPQIAVSVTFKTNVRKRWGRNYLPSPTRAMCDGNGRLDTTAAQAIADAFALLTDNSGSGAALTCYSRQFQTHEDPYQIQVDDVFDVIRRRRFSSAHARKVADA